MAISQASVASDFIILDNNDQNDTSTNFIKANDALRNAYLEKLVDFHLRIESLLKK